MLKGGKVEKLEMLGMCVSHTLAFSAFPPFFYLLGLLFMLYSVVY